MASPEAGSPDERAAFRARIERHGLTLLCETPGTATPLHPAPACVPALWRYRDVRPLVLEAARLSRGHDAEQRALVLENPGLRGAGSITHGLHAALYTLLPGEPGSHRRHSRWSLRLLLEGDGACSTHEDRRTDHTPGDLLIVAPWGADDQRSAGESPAVWLEGIEVPMVAPIESVEAARTDHSSVPSAHGDGTRIGKALAPDRGSDSALAAFPYARTRAALADLRETGAPHPSHGFRMLCAAPLCAAPTRVEVFVALLPAGFRGRPSRATDSTVYCVVVGRGESRIGDEALAWEPHDVFVVPAWCSVTHAAAEETVLLGYSDRPAHQALGLWREEILD